MDQTLVMTVIGPDRPGLVELVANLVADHEGNWLESRMSHLGGQFAGILRVRLPAPREAALVQALEELHVQGLKVVVHSDAPPPSRAPGQLAQLEIVGQDRPGIVRQISRALAAHRINVEELNTECSSAPMSGETLFTARARLQLPPDCDPHQLRQNLEKIASDLFVECSLAELTDPPECQKV